MSSDRVDALVALVARRGCVTRHEAAILMGVSSASMDRYVRVAVAEGRIQRKRVKGWTVLVVGGAQ